MRVDGTPTTTEHAVLGLLAFGEASGYDLNRAASRSIAYMWAPSRSQIYKVLPRLVAAGLATSRQVEQELRPDKELYRITRRGRDALRAWVSIVEDDPDGGIAIFILKIFFGFAASPDAALAQLESYANGVAARLAAFEEMDAGLSPDEPVHSRIALHHGIARARATLAWADETRVVLEQLRRQSAGSVPSR
jgi:PadR family transcriptional regulator, regulatory protein AphA